MGRLGVSSEKNIVLSQFKYFRTCRVCDDASVSGMVGWRNHWWWEVSFVSVVFETLSMALCPLEMRRFECHVPVGKLKEIYSF